MNTREGTNSFLLSLDNVNSSLLILHESPVARRREYSHVSSKKTRDHPTKNLPRPRLPSDVFFRERYQNTKIKLKSNGVVAKLGDM